jgi:MFS family permease
VSSSRLGESARAFHDVFASRPLRRLSLAFAGSFIGDWAFAMALAVYAYERDGAAAVGLLALARWSAAAVAAPFLSVLADRHRRRAVMIGSDAIRLVAVAIAAGTVWADGPAGIVYVAALLTTVISSAYQPAQTALLPSLTTSPEELTAVNVVISTIESVGSFLGPAIGGLLLIWVGTGTVMAFDALTFAWSMLLLTALPRGDVPAADVEPVGLLGDVAEGFRAVAGDRGLSLIMALFGAQTLVCGILNVLIVVMALELLDLGNSGVGTLNAAIGVGGLAGSVVAAALVGRGRLAGDFAIGLIAWGLPIALIALYVNTGFALAMLAVVGIGNVLVDVTGFTLLQRVAPDDVLGRVFGVLESVFALALGVGGALAPLMVHAFGVRWSLAVTGLLLPVLALASLPALARIDARAALPERVELLRGVPFLSPLPEATLERISSLLQATTVAASEAVFDQGDQGDRFYLIESGEAAVVRDGRQLARLGPGDYFGEIALVRDVPRTAGVRAETALTLLTLDRDEFIAAVTGHAPSREAADAVITSRLSGLRAGVATL